MPSVTVPVLKPLTYQGRSYVRGQSVTMRPIDALAAARAGTVSLSKSSKSYATTVMTAEAPSAAKAQVGRRRRGGRGGGTYQGRDMLAQDPAK